jgi:hypothetical protein
MEHARYWVAVNSVRSRWIGERILQDLEEANAFVAALDARRSSFRYHHLFADLPPRLLPGPAPSACSPRPPRALRFRGFSAQDQRREPATAAPSGRPDAT